MRDWIIAAVFLVVLVPPAVLAGSAVLGLNPVLTGGWIAAAYFLAVWLDLLPPGRPREPEDPRIALRAQARVPGRVATSASSSGHPRTGEVGFAVAGVILGVMLLGIVVSRSGGSSAGGRPGLAAVAGLGAPSQPPETRTATVSPVAQTGQGATATPAAAGTGNLTGTWLITDTVTSGPSQGQSFQLLVALVETNGLITGSGDGMTLSGERTKDGAELQFVRVGSSGTFQWKATNGKLTGTFTDSGGNNSGTSVAERR